MAIRYLSKGEQGVWYDPSDMSTLFQDAAGTIPVTAAGQPVGMMMRNKSGRGNHATQATATSRPLLQTESGKWYLAFDGVDDGLFTSGNVDFTVTNKMTMWAGTRKLSDATLGLVVELTSNGSTIDGGVGLFTPGGIGFANFGYRLRGTATQAAVNAPSTYPAPITNTHCIEFDTTGSGTGATAQIRPRVNGVILTNGSGTSAGPLANAPLFIGRRNNASNPLNGRIYSLIIRGAASTAQQITDTENYINNKTGAY